MKVADLVAIDVHTHAEVSCRQPADAFWQPYEEAANAYFKAGKRPTIAETVAHYRERNRRATVIPAKGGDSVSAAAAALGSGCPHARA